MLQMSYKVILIKKLGSKFNENKNTKFSSHEYNQVRSTSCRQEVMRYVYYFFNALDEINRTVKLCCRHDAFDRLFANARHCSLGSINLQHRDIHTLKARKEEYDFTEELELLGPKKKRTILKK